MKKQGEEVHEEVILVETLVKDGIVEKICTSIQERKKANPFTFVINKNYAVSKMANMYCLGKYGLTYEQLIIYSGSSKTEYEKDSMSKEINKMIDDAKQIANLINKESKIK